MEIVDKLKVNPCFLPLGYIDVRHCKFGAVGNGEVDDTEAILAAIDYAGTSQCTIWLSFGTYLISSNINFPSNVTVQRDSGAVLDDDGNDDVVVTFNSQVYGPLDKFFNFKGNGSKVVFSTVKHRVPVEWWGLVKGNDIEQSQAIDNANVINTAISSTIEDATLLFHDNYEVYGTLNVTILNEFGIWSMEGETINAGVHHHKDVDLGTDLIATTNEGAIVGWCVPKLKNLTLGGYALEDGSTITNACLRLRRCLRGFINDIETSFSKVGVYLNGCISVSGYHWRFKGCEDPIVFGTIRVPKPYSTNACCINNVYIREYGNIKNTSTLKFVADYNNGVDPLKILQNHILKLDYGGIIPGSISKGIHLIGEAENNQVHSAWLEEIDKCFCCEADPTDITAVPKFNRFVDTRMVKTNKDIELLAGLDNIWEGGYMTSDAVVDIYEGAIRNKFIWVTNMPYVKNSEFNPGCIGLNDQNVNSRTIIMSHGSSIDDHGVNYCSESITIGKDKSIKSLEGSEIDNNGGEISIFGGYGYDFGKGGDINIQPGIAGISSEEDGNCEICRIGGNVGIGDKPLTKLHVNGVITIGLNSGPNMNIRQGVGNPGFLGLDAPRGSLYIRIDGGHVLYTKIGEGNKDWVAVGQSPLWLSESISTISHTNDLLETDLASITIPKNAHLEYQGVKFIASGQKIGKLGTKVFKFYFGGQSIKFHPAQNNLNDVDPWIFEAFIIFRSATNHRAVWKGYSNTVTVPGRDNFNSNLSVDPVIAKITGKLNDIDDSINQSFWNVKLVPKGV